MKWFDFTDLTFLIFFIVAIVLFLLLIGVIIVFSFLNHFHRSYSKDIKQQTNALRIYVINLKDSNVLLFNRTSLKRKRLISVNSFYQGFILEDQRKIKDWILNICSFQDNTPKYITVGALTNYGRRVNFSILKCVKYNKEEGKLHLESYMFKYISPAAIDNTNVSSSRNRFLLKDKTEVNDYLLKSKSIDGATIHISFFDNSLHPFGNEDAMKTFFFNLKNSIFSFCVGKNNPRKIYNVDERSLYIFDTSIKTQEAAYQLVLSLERTLNKDLSISGNNDRVKIAMGVLLNSMFYHDTDAILTHAKEASLLADSENKTFYFYEKSVTVELHEDKYANEILNTLKEKKLRYVYRPILNITNKKCYGYLSTVKFINSPFIGYNEMMNHAYKAKKAKELYSLVVRNILSKYINETPTLNAPFFMPISIYDLEYLDDILRQIDGLNKIKLVLVLKESELKEIDFDSLKNTLNDLRTLGYSFGLFLSEKPLFLETTVMECFSYFLTNSKSVFDAKSSNIIGLSIRTLIESLLKYKKPIIAVGLESWRSVELIVKSGLTLLSTDVIGEYNEMILPLNKKKVEKAVQLSEYK